MDELFIVMESRYYHSDVTGLPHVRVDGKFETEEMAYKHIAEKTKNCEYHKDSDGVLMFSLSPKYESEFCVRKVKF